MRVLGQLLAKSAPDEHVRAAIGNLLLAKTLSDIGFDVEFEPGIAGGTTPDLLVTRAGSSFLIEVRHIDAPERDRAGRARLRDALRDRQTHQPISLRGVTLPGDASIRRFLSYLDELWATGAPAGEHVFRDGSVLVVFELHPRYEVAMPAIVGWQGPIHVGRPYEVVRSHIDTKLKRYKVPIIVALDFGELTGAFETVEEVLVGQRCFEIPVNSRVEDGPSTATPRLGRLVNGLIHRRGSDGDRARSRLQAVLPFGLRWTDDGSYALYARVLANPARRHPPALAEFAPIPRLVVVDENDQERLMQYMGEKAGDGDQNRWWCHVPR